MHLMLAAPDRGLIAAYRGLLEDDFGETEAVFDGTQVLHLLEQKSFDLVILDRNLPRIDTKKLIELLNERAIPVIALWDSSLTSRRLASTPLASAYLSYPFTPVKLYDYIRKVMRYAASRERITLSGLEFTPCDFALPDGQRITVDELDTLFALRDGKALTIENDGIYVNALNMKLERSRFGVRIKYESDKGFYLAGSDQSPSNMEAASVEADMED